MENKFEKGMYFHRRYFFGSHKMRSIVRCIDSIQDSVAQPCYGMFARNDDYCAQKIILLKEKKVRILLLQKIHFSILRFE